MKRGTTKILIAVIGALGMAVGGIGGYSICNNINNNIIINVDGQQIDVNKSNSTSLQKKITALETKNKELTTSNSKLETKVKTLLTENNNQITADLYNAKLIIDGVESNADSSDSVAVINKKIIFLNQPSALYYPKRHLHWIYLMKNYMLETKESKALSY